MQIIMYLYKKSFKLHKIMLTQKLKYRMNKKVIIRSKKVII